MSGDALERAGCLRRLAGPAGEVRSCAVVVHGLRSRADDMQALASHLVERGGFGAAWAYDSALYRGLTNPRFRWHDAIDLAIAPSPKRIGFQLLRMGGRKAAELVATPTWLVEGAADDVLHGLPFLPAGRVCLIGHSLGGIVARCAAARAGADGGMGSVVTLGAPHALWRSTHAPSDWDPLEAPPVPSMTLLGDRDWVVLYPWAAEGGQRAGRDGAAWKILLENRTHHTVHAADPSGGLTRLIADLHARGALTDDAYHVRPAAKGYPRIERGPRPEGDESAEPVSAHRGRWLACSDDAGAGAA